MTPDELRSAIAALGMSSGYALARLLGVTPRAVQHWLDGSREIPKPAILLIQAAIKFPAVAKWLNREIVNTFDMHSQWDDDASTAMLIQMTADSCSVSYERVVAALRTKGKRKAPQTKSPDH